MRVQDTGSGIAPEMLPHLFEPFAQGEATLDRAKGGLGLGLTLVKALVELHGGAVRGESAGPGHGSTFTISLPLGTAPAPTAAHEPGPTPGRAPKRVLIIEDNIDTARSLSRAVEIGGHIVDVAGNGAEGIEKARTFGPDIVLCDIGLPGMSGFDVARALRAEPGLAHVSLIAVSGYAQPRDLAQAKAAGFDAHLAKPFEIDTLLALLESPSPTR